MDDSGWLHLACKPGVHYLMLEFAAKKALARVDVVVQRRALNDGRSVGQRKRRGTTPRLSG